MTLPRCLGDGVRAGWCRHDLRFLAPAVTSRQVMLTKETYFLRLTDLRSGAQAIGECALFRGLSAEDTPGYADSLAALCDCINGAAELPALSSSLLFGLESALLQLANGGGGVAYDTPWTRGEDAIAINGLVWMGTEDEMRTRIARKLDDGFRCVKLKIGGIDFDAELGLLRAIRRRFPADVLELRLDANGAFTPENALERLHALSRFGIHSLEQPVRAGQWEAMARICRESPIPIALDEELIGVSDAHRRRSMLDEIAPQYIILKPSLCGGIDGAKRWIADASDRGIGWWITSALESNVGLNVIAQFASTYALTMPQGLGTGALYSNNIPSPLYMRGDTLMSDPARGWDYSVLTHWQ